MITINANLHNEQNIVHFIKIYTQIYLEYICQKLDRQTSGKFIHGDKHRKDIKDTNISFKNNSRHVCGLLISHKNDT